MGNFLLLLIKKAEEARVIVAIAMGVISGTVGEFVGLRVEVGVVVEVEVAADVGFAVEAAVPVGNDVVVGDDVGVGDCEGGVEGVGVGDGAVPGENAWKIFVAGLSVPSWLNKPSSKVYSRTLLL